MRTEPANNAKHRSRDSVLTQMDDHLRGPVIAGVRRIQAITQMKTPAPSTFESELLREIASAVERRGKAIRYHGRLKYSRFFENSIERINLDFAGILGFRVRLSIWSDGVLWLGITKPGPRRIGGWAYRDEFHSHVDSLDTNAFVERFEQTIHSPTQARSIWPASQDETQNT